MRWTSAPAKRSAPSSAVFRKPGKSPKVSRACTSARWSARWSCSPVTAQSFPTIFIAVLLCLFAGTAEARPAVIYSVGGKFDGPFNAPARVGAERHREAPDEAYGATEHASPAQPL